MKICFLNKYMEKISCKELQANQKLAFSFEKTERKEFQRSSSRTYSMPNSPTALKNSMW